MNIAVSGCTHGNLDLLYQEVTKLQDSKNIKVSLLLCTGDFHAIRDFEDLDSMTCPAKFRKLGDFHKYYTGQAVAPVTTVFIGGNHESVSHMHEFQNGGWVAPNIYYMGRVGVIKFGDLRIAGVSGIYHQKDYFKNVPTHYTPAVIKTLYRYRKSEVENLMRISPPDIMLSHDWPRGIYHYGDVEQLIRKKPFFKEEIYANQLGSPPTEELLEILKP